MKHCYLALGANLGNSERQLRTALKHLKKLPHSRLQGTAPFYRSGAWGRKSQPAFCNTAVALHTRLSPKCLLRHCQAIEKRMGRVRKVRYGARTIDIDILLYDHKEVKLADLTIPHPRLIERDFMLTPLLFLAPDACLPNGTLLAYIKPLYITL